MGNLMIYLDFLKKIDEMYSDGFLIPRIQVYEFVYVNSTLPRDHSYLKTISKKILEKNVLSNPHTPDFFSQYLSVSEHNLQLEIKKTERYVKIKKILKKYGTEQFFKK